MRTQLILVATLMCLLFAGCAYDNYDEPNAMLSGKITYNGNPVGVRSNGTQLEIWQDGFELYSKIAVHIAHDGTYSAALFNGTYKVVRLAGAPWEAQSKDTVTVEVRGNTVKDIEVQPFFAIKGESFQKSSDNVVAQFTIDKVVNDASLKSVRFYFGNNILVDQNRNAGAVNADLASINLGSTSTLTAPIPASLASKDYVFVRVGVQSDKSNEYIYTQVQKLQLK
ncbi:DUF3823 domain-containing protein [Parabacteroides sp. OttesenSCG-928-O15]|nr:DUF3823 domain-containing protein [Parabacteroides sp. OttesenSCG-928-O15]